jgi:hypothetical protein
MRLAELRKTVEAEKATAKAAQEVKRAARIEKDKEAALRPIDPSKSGTGFKSGAFYQTKNPQDDTGKVFPYYRTSVAEDYYKDRQRERPISSMYSVTPSQYKDAYGVEFTGSDPDSMRRLLALQNGTASVMDSERSVLDQRSQDAYNSRPANPNPTTAAYTGLAPMSVDQMRVGVRNNIQSPEDRKVMENAERVGGITPESIAAMDRQRADELERIRRSRIYDLNHESMSERFGIPPVQTMSQMMDPDSPMATGPGRKGLPRGAVPRK